MPSDERAGARAWRLARSQGLGIALGLATAGLLATGSFVMALSPEEATPSLDDVTLFLREPSLRHAWFYLLVVVLAAFAVNTTLCTVDHLARAWRAGQRNLRTFAPSVFHLAFGVALLAHGVGGLFSREDGMVLLGPRFRTLPDGREARVVSLAVDEHPDGSPRQVSAWVEVRSPDGTIETEEVSHNGPLSSGLGTDLLILARHATMPNGAHALVLRARHAPGNPVALSAAVLVGLATLMMGRRWV